jgi:hypothetical protein
MTAIGETTIPHSPLMSQEERKKERKKEEEREQATTNIFYTGRYKIQ